MAIINELQTWARFLSGLPAFLRQTINLDEAGKVVRERLEARETNFLSLVENGIFGYERSPYLPMLKQARCEMGDIRNMVRRDGLEKALLALREAGIYASFEEYKGRKPIVRNGEVIPVEIEEFNNPYLARYYRGESGGTTGTATRVLIDLDHLAAQAPSFILGAHANNILSAPTAVWLDILPDVAGVACILRSSRLGNTTLKWFSPDMLGTSNRRMSAKFRLATYSMIAAGRLSGTPIPWPETVRLHEAERIAVWVAETVQIHGACLLVTHVSKAVRVCLAAREAGIDLTGATFFGGGEPPSETKVREITRTGAAWLPMYPFSEYGIVGIGCANPADENDVHILNDGLALTQYPRPIPGSDILVDAFNFTTLLPTAPKIFLNVESDDYGVVEERQCGCLLEQYGYPTHVRHIRSFSKLTGEGGTLVGSEMIRILEDVLPSRFGGSALDYQLLEEEGENGLTRLSLLVHPRLQIENESAVIRAVLEELQPKSTGPGTGGFAAEITRNTWQQAQTLRVKRMEPILTGHGKMMPLYSSRLQGPGRPPGVQ